MDDGTERDLCIVDLMQKNMIDEYRSAGFFNNNLTTTKLIRKSEAYFNVELNWMSLMMMMMRA